MYMNDGNGIYERFNIQRPADFTGHSLSVSDVVVLNDGSTVKAYYVDSIGFAELPELAAGGRCLIGCILSRLSGDKKTIRRSRNRKEAEKVKIP